MAIQILVDDAGLKPWDLSGPAPTERIEFLAWRVTLERLEQLEPSIDARLLITTQRGGRLPISGSDVVVLCINDEDSRWPGYTTQTSAVFKTYGTTRSFFRQLRGVSTLPWLASATATELVVQARRLPSVGRRLVQVPRGAHSIVDVPLGALAPIARTLVPFERREVDVSYLGSLVTGMEPGRRAHANSKARTRRELMEALTTLEGDPRTRVTTRLRGSYHESQHFHEEYAATLATTRIAPCPRGGRSLETYRVFEALAHGCVAVTDALPDRWYYEGAPLLSVRRWAELPDLVRDLLAHPERLRTMHEAGLRWWADQWSPDAVAALIHRRLVPRAA